MKFRYEMIYSSNDAEDYWYSNGRCRIDSGEIYFKRNTNPSEKGEKLLSFNTDKSISCVSRYNAYAGLLSATDPSLVETVEHDRKE